MRNALRNFRARGGLTQREMALRLGISTTAYLFIEKGYTPTPHDTTLLKIADQLGITFEEAVDLTKGGDTK
jgi:DNA-binding XRE family transcriptional regulator